MEDETRKTRRVGNRTTGESHKGKRQGRREHQKWDGEKRHGTHKTRKTCHRQDNIGTWEEGQQRRKDKNT